MKRLLTLYILLIVSNIYAQDTLYLPVHGLGHEKYVLKNDGSFIYYSHLCASTFTSFGTYKRTVFGYKFTYDTTRCPKPFITQVIKKTTSDSLTLFFYNMVDSTRQPYFNAVTIGEQSYRCNFVSDSIRIPKQDLKTNELKVGYNRDKLNFLFDTTSSELYVYLPPTGVSYSCGINNIRKLKKTRFGYLHKFNVYDENREKPWKKGTKRVVKHYYQLRSNNNKQNNS